VQNLLCVKIIGLIEIFLELTTITVLSRKAQFWHCFDIILLPSVLVASVLFAFYALPVFHSCFIASVIFVAFLFGSLHIVDLAFLHFIF